MIILVTGATGLIGSRLVEALLAQGHEVIGVARESARLKALSIRTRTVSVDFHDATEVMDWWPLLYGVDVVINTVGLRHERRAHHFRNVHVRAPRALFKACVLAGVRRVIHLSSLGADPSSHSALLASKAAAEANLLKLPLDGVVVQPSLVFALDAPMIRWLMGLASLPRLPVPAGGRQTLQPIHLQDLVACLVRLATSEAYARRIIRLAGPRPWRLHDALATLRRAMRMRPVASLSVPTWVVRTTAALGSRLRWPFNQDTWRLIETSPSTEGSITRTLLGHPAKDLDQFIATGEAEGARSLSAWVWQRPLLQAAMAAFWLGQMVGLWPAASGLPRTLADWLGGALALGAATLAIGSMRQRRRWWWTLQALAISMLLVAAWAGWAPSEGLLSSLRAAGPALAVLWILGDRASD